MLSFLCQILYKKSLIGPQVKVAVKGQIRANHLKNEVRLAEMKATETVIFFTLGHVLIIFLHFGFQIIIITVSNVLVLSSQSTVKHTEVPLVLSVWVPFNPPLDTQTHLHDGLLCFFIVLFLWILR